MPYAIDETHDPKLESWIESANDPTTDFPIQNLPLCWFLKTETVEEEGETLLVQSATVGVRIGDQLLDLEHAGDLGLFTDQHGDNPAEYPPQDWFERIFEEDLSNIRRQLQALLKAGAEKQEQVAEALIPVSTVELVEQGAFVGAIGDYTDFYASVHHATNVGSMFRPDNPLLPNYKWIPVGYHGRASSVVPSGTEIVRPKGQTAPAEDGGAPGFGPCKLLDYELEMGLVVSRGNELGDAISIEEAEDHILGMCLLNDWSARDMQKWEYVPLGPFLAKSFATSVSPYIVTMEALAPFRAPRYARPDGDPQPLEHLDSDHDRAHGAVDVTLEVYIQTAKMKQMDLAPHRLSTGSFKDMYWTIAQMLTHHASNGCNMQPGDLLGSGTVSGPTRESRGCLLEMTWDGDPFATPPVAATGADRTALKLPSGEERKFLADGDEIIIKGYCEREGFRRIGFGECRGVIAPAR